MAVGNIVGLYGEDNLVQKLLSELGSNGELYLDNKYYSATLCLKKQQRGGAVIYVFDKELEIKELEKFEDASVKLCVGNNDDFQLQILDFGFEYVAAEDKERLIEALECNIWSDMKLKQNVDYELEMNAYDDSVTVGSETVNGDFGDLQSAEDFDKVINSIDFNEINHLKSGFEISSKNDGFESILNAIKDIKRNTNLMIGDADTKNLDERRRIAENVALAFSMAFPE
ncbi:hypothetical protein HDV01_001531 [Terramyces sp. JEL0728]|nr:hypothetical protein HDV01_001531 [Terramyces sp. JEL0728]